MRIRFYLLTFLFSIVSFCALTQVTFIIDELPDYTPQQDVIYIAGNFNGWAAGSENYILHKNEQDKWTITLDQQPGGTSIQFKFTRGSWETVEKGPAGEELPDRQFTFGNGQTIGVVIQNWADNGGGATSTAAANVTVMDNNFYMPQLNRNRRIWLYFPPGYETSGIAYPVLYMHDGQNLFDNLTAYSGEWQVDETLNALASEGQPVPIVVGIDNGGSDRINEYTPWVNSQYGGGEGDLYIRFIVETLKPYIDANYRTIPGRNTTAIMGSSLGGLISHFGALSYQSVFSKVGIFSPSYWFSDSVWSFTHDIVKQYDMRFYQLCGTLEGSNTVSDMLKMNDSLVEIEFQQENIFNKVVAGGQHNETLWRNSFSEAYQWLFDSASSVEDELHGQKAVICFPNPVGDVLFFQGLPISSYDSVCIYTINGQMVKQIQDFDGQKAAVGDLPAGAYIIRFLKNGIELEGKFIRK